MHTSRFLTFNLLFLISTLYASAQRFPEQMRLSPDYRRLITGNLPTSGFYEANTIHTINLQFTNPNYWTMLTNNFPGRVDMPCVMTVDGIRFDSVGVRFKGNSSYSAIGASLKKSFNISLDDWVPGQNIGGYNTLVLNNSYSDPSFLAEVFYERQISKHIPSPKGNFVHLFINGQDWGIYDNVQQLNHDFEKEWFLSHDGALWRARNPPGSPLPNGHNGDSLASLYNIGTDTTLYSGHYNLKSSGIPDPNTRLMTLCQVLDTVAASRVEFVLGNYLDIDRTLWYLASENAFVDDDSYIFKGRKDYYIYYEPESGRITPLEMDGNDALDATVINTGIFYNANNPNFPLLYKLLNMPNLRQRYLAHMRTILNDEFDSTEAFPILDAYAALIDPLVFSDPEKLYTYADFQNSIPGLKSFIVNRKNFILNDTEMVNVTGPLISNVIYYTGHLAWNRPRANDTVWVTADVSNPGGLDHVSLYSAQQLVGKFDKQAMFDDGSHHDQTAGDGIYGAAITNNPGATWTRFYIEAASNNSARTISYQPEGAEHDVYAYLVQPARATDTTVVINEVMAKNNTTAADSAGEYDDWIELFNNSNQAKDISGYFLTDTIFNLRKWMIPQGTVIPANGYLIIWADETEGQGSYHTNFKLSSSNGESLMLLNPAYELVDQVSFGPQQTDRGFARVPNGTGSFVIQFPTFSFNNEALPAAAIFTADSLGCTPMLVNLSNHSQHATAYAWDFGDGSALDSTFAPSHSYLIPGNYTIRLSATDGIYTDLDTFSIQAFPTPSIDLGLDTVNTLNSSYILDAGAGFSHYRWSVSDSNRILIVDSNGLYCVTVSNNGICMDSDCVYVNFNGLGINQPDHQLLSFYPNPANDRFVLFTDDSRLRKFEICNVLGEVIFKSEFSYQLIIPTSDWLDGLYVFRMEGYSALFEIHH